MPDCVAKIIAVTDGAACGPINTVNLNATPGAGSTEVRWYSAPRGGVLLASNTGSWTTPSLSSSTTYYVTAFNGTCESLYRIPVTATINPTPTVSITSSVPAVCSEVVNINLTSAGDFATDTVFFQDFESGMGTFTVSTPTNINAGADTPWSVKTSPYQPTTTTVWKPAVNSGAVGSIGNHFAFTTSDYTNSTIETRMSSPAIDVSPYTDLTLTFDHYYSAYGGDRGVLQVATNAAGNNWTDVVTYATDLGSASSFVRETVDLTPYTGIATLRFRFVYIAQWDDGWAVDNVKITGKKPLTTNFDWTGSNVTVYDADCVTPYSASSTAVCIKPSAIQIENSTQFVVNASAILSNGCSAVGTIVIPNETKTWDTASTNWGSNNWKPDTAVPTSDKCVVIKTPVNIGSTTDAVAKNITVKSAGEIEIAGNLTVTDFIKNETGDADNFVVKSDGNLVQINAVTNTDPIRADRYVTDMDNVLATQMDYVYWSAPVTGQKLRGTAPEGGFSPGTPNNRFFEYNESTDYFVSTPDAVFTPGKGYAIRAEVNAVHPANAAGYSETYRFRGIPNNGDIPVNITRSLDTGAVVHGYNLVGNPYPSNISFDRLYAGNPGLIYNTVWLWTNATYTLTQQGSGYSGNNYAVYNGSGGNNATTTVAIPAPDGIIKVGQGFLVQKRTLGTGQLLFKNSYGEGQDLRVTDAGTFYQKGAEIKNRFTLTLTSPAQLVNSQLIAYVNGATNGYEQDYDAEIMGMSSDLFYSVLGDRRLLIQGKGVFTDSDAVPLGANFFTDGQYTVTLNSAEGIFAGGQSVYLKDKQTGIITDLSAGSYSFTAAKGISDGRFEVIYKPETILSTDGTQKDDLTVYRDGDDFVIRSSGSKITGVELYDGAGRLLYHSRLNQTATRIEGAELNEGVYVLKIERGALVSSKKIMK
ncbi:Ig-like domain-containing protein [Kaistella sp.]|uniref:Ig-like domain-containing protein n=1 Tax=Kaistella sp. TaxID=2782235 RepID=UPI002F93DB8B